MNIAAGEFLFKEGEKINTLYILSSGSLTALRQDFNHIKIIETFSPGTIVGELPSSKNPIRTYSVKAEEDSIVEEISLELYHKTLTSSPKWFSEFIQSLQSRKKLLVQKNEKKQAILFLPALLSSLDYFYKTCKAKKIPFENILSCLEPLVSSNPKIVSKLCHALDALGLFYFNGKEITFSRPAVPSMLYEVLQEKASFSQAPTKILTTISQLVLTSFLAGSKEDFISKEGDSVTISGLIYNQNSPSYCKNNRKNFKELEDLNILQVKTLNSEKFSDCQISGNLELIQDLVELNRIYPLLDYELAKHL